MKTRPHLLETIPWEALKALRQAAGSDQLDGNIVVVTEDRVTRSLATQKSRHKGSDYDIGRSGAGTPSGLLPEILFEPNGCIVVVIFVLRVIEYDTD